MTLRVIVDFTLDWGVTLVVLPSQVSEPFREDCRSKGSLRVVGASMDALDEEPKSPHTTKRSPTIDGFRTYFSRSLHTSSAKVRCFGDGDDHRFHDLVPDDGATMADDEDLRNP
ncbi:hypothetical protein Dimus_029684 [Dionaea muscipula]